ncbi:cytochrome c [Defluviimonas sp. WL0024]|uniref:Cytochrome c n=1 Tax=Albidovulum salinarum TaxID=2984153 RepID=A0ABT2X6T7_9RHOB|nr:cytochrome c [Defluviimonas sp. WL0024]MCU9849644.1 cytochrome c [Defluviimonas sp. WL0024]
MRALALLILLAASPVMAADDTALGRDTFHGSCASCHGAEAKGGGPMSEILTVEVPDLTTIAARNGGAFPWLKVIHIVDGRTGLRGHGDPMPVFGAVFTGDTSVADARDGTPVITSARVLAVVDYLAAIQATP